MSAADLVGALRCPFVASRAGSNLPRLPSGVETAETVARGAARTSNEVTGSANSTVDVAVEEFLKRVIATGPLRSTQLWDAEGGGGAAAGSGAAASKPALA